MNWLDKNKNFEKLFILTWIIFLFSCLFLLSFTSHAEEAYFPMLQNNNSKFSEAVKTKIDDYFDNENNYIFCKWYNYSANRNQIYVLTFPKNGSIQLYGEINNSGTGFSLYTTGGSIPNSNTYRIQIPNDASYINVFQNYDLSYFGGDSNLYSSSVDYVSNFRMFTSNSENAIVVLKYGSDPTPEELGLPVPPDFTGLDPGWIGAGAADVVTPPASVPPSITINNYTWTTNNPPAFDSSSIEAAIESVGDIITYQANWLSSNLSGEFSNLGNNLKNLVDYIGKTIQYFGDLIIKNIQNGIQNLYDNLEALVKPILDKVAYITEPIDTAVIYDSYSSTSFNSDVTAVKTNFTSFVNQFNNITEPTTYKIPIHFENITMFSDVGTQYIQLDWLNSVKTLLRSFLWMVTTYGLLAAIFDAIPKYINGGGDESD